MKDAGGSAKQQLEAGREADRQAEKERQVSLETLNPKPPSREFKTSIATSRPPSAPFFLNPKP